MSGYTVKRLEEVPDIFGGKYPGVMRMLSDPLEAEQVAITHRHMTPKSGGKGGYGHRHKTQEEIYFVVSGTLEFKLDEEVLELHGGSAVRVAPGVVRSVWNEGPEDAQLIIVSTRIADVRADAEMIEDFWPE
jgi:mannose-6-phosphate isomerase-like protein (cupin superfamily)